MTIEPRCPDCGANYLVEGQRLHLPTCRIKGPLLLQAQDSTTIFLNRIVAIETKLAASEATVARLTAALASARSQVGETDDQVQTDSPGQVSGTSAQAGRTPRTRL